MIMLATTRGQAPCINVSMAAVVRFYKIFYVVLQVMFFEVIKSFYWICGRPMSNNGPLYFPTTIRDVLSNTFVVNSEDIVNTVIKYLAVQTMP
jgi:hypothetical protein